MKPHLVLFFATTLLVVRLTLHAAVVGMSPPALPLTAERIAAMPANTTANTQLAWTAYLERSKHQMAEDQASFAQEFKATGLKETLPVPDGHDAKSLPLDQAAGWYGGAEARRIADIVVSFQTPAGGWSKNIDLAKHLRQPGERYSHDGGSKFTDQSDNDRPANAAWSYVGTIDNDATTTQLRYLAKVITALPADAAAPYRAAFSRGLEYILAAQYPNGGWPQVWPLEGGYHDAITFNDGAMLHVLALQRDVADGKNEFAFATSEQRRKSADSLQRGLSCLLACQLSVANHVTIWCQQHDMLTLQPCSARNYEMPAAASAESAEIMMFLMKIQKPSAEVVHAIKSAATWFQKNAIYGEAFRPINGDRHLVAQTGAGPIWPRYSEIGTDRPLFGDRDKTIHDNVEDLSRERRNGYAWFNNSAKRALEQYDHWQKSGPAAPDLVK